MCPGEVALELEFQTLDPSCLLPCIVVGEDPPESGEGARASFVPIAADMNGAPTMFQVML